MSKLSIEQEEKIARLLIHFTNRTNSEILGRFDRGTRNRIRNAMGQFKDNEPVASAESLRDFAEFLYFVPETTDSISPRQENSQASNRHFEFNDIVRLDDDSLDKLLKAAPVELTLDTLCCSPSSFVNRVLGRLSEDDAIMVRERLGSNDSIDYSQMQSTHQQICEFAENLIQQSSLNDPRGS